MDPMDTIKTATSEAALTLKQQDVGTVEASKFADLVALNRNLLEDIRAFQDGIATVYRGGERVDSTK